MKVNPYQTITAISIHKATLALLSCHFQKIATVSHFRLVLILKTISFVRYERFEKNQVQVKHGSSQGAIKKTPVPGGTPVTSSASKSLMDAPLIDFSSSSSTAAAAASEAPQSFTQVPSMAHFPVS